MIRQFGRTGWLALCALCWASAAAQATNYYVSPSGSSSNNGSAGLPWRQIRDALPVVGPGDTVFVADGSYLGFTITSKNGASGSPITIKATGSGAIVTVTTDRPDNRDTIKISTSSHIVIDGLTSFGGNRAAVRVDQSHNVTIKNGVFGNNATWGIFTNHSNNLLLEYNRCYGSVAEHGIYVSNSCTNPTVRGNICYNNARAGLHFNGDASSGGGNGLITGALVEKNILYSNGASGAAAINMDGVRSSTIRNNLIYNNLATGIALYQIDGGLGPSGINVYYNTIDQPTNGRWCLHISEADTNAGPIVIRNNILINRHSFRGSIEFFDSSDVASTDSDYNILNRVTPNNGATTYTLAQWQALGHDTHSINPSISSLWVSPAGGDYHLLSNAPAVGAGIAIASVNEDYEGTWRPTSGSSDIGCDQRITQIPGPTAYGMAGFNYAYYAFMNSYYGYMATSNSNALLAYQYAYNAYYYAMLATYQDYGSARTNDYLIAYYNAFYCYAYATRAVNTTGNSNLSAAAANAYSAFVSLFYAYHGY